MPAHFRRCEGDGDLARFTLYFIEHRADFNTNYSLSDTIAHVLEYIQHSHIIMIENDRKEMIGWGQYHYTDEHMEIKPDGEIAFVQSVNLDKSFRGGRAFLQGFRYMANRIAEENNHVTHFRFHAHSDNLYLNRMYSKFARIVGTQERDYGSDNVYSTEFSHLLRYLNRVT